jgi:hypothetical protein
MKALVSLTIMMVCSLSLFSQASFETTVDDKTDLEPVNKILIDGSRDAKSFTDISGSPYLNESFVDGYITLLNQEQINFKCRYNIYTDEIEFELDQKLKSLINLDKFKFCMIGETKLVYQPYIQLDKIKRGYFIVLAEGDFVLLQKKGITYLPAEEAVQPYGTPKPKRFVPNVEKYYLVYQNNPAILITSFKELYKSFPELKPVLDSYKNKKSLKKTIQFVNLVNYINSNLGSY